MKHVQDGGGSDQDGSIPTKDNKSVGDFILLPVSETCLIRFPAEGSKSEPAVFVTGDEKPDEPGTHGAVAVVKNYISHVVIIRWRF